MNTSTRNQLKAIIREVLTEVKAKKMKEDKSEKMKKIQKSSKNTTEVKKTKTAPTSVKTEKAMPSVKKPAKPSVSKKSLKESILQIIQEELSEMARTPMTVTNGVVSGAGSKFIVADPSSKTGFSLQGHPKFPDGTPAEKPKGPYVPKGNTGMGRPPVEKDIASSEIDIKVNGSSIGKFDLNAKLPSGKPDMTPLQKRIRQFIYNDPDMAAYDIDQSVISKLDQLSDLEMDGKLTPANKVVNLRVDGNTIRV